MIEYFEKNMAVSPHIIETTKCGVISNYNTNKIISIECKDINGNIVFKVSGGDINVVLKDNKIK